MADILSLPVQQVSAAATTDQEWAAKSLSHADEVQRPEPGSRQPKLPGSRDFR